MKKKKLKTEKAEPTEETYNDDEDNSDIRLGYCYVTLCYNLNTIRVLL